MGQLMGFLNIEKKNQKERKPVERVHDWGEYKIPLVEKDAKEQAARCMDCGIPYCQIGTTINRGTTGCPIHNLIPEWNDLVYHGLWKEAYDRLAKTNNFPEFTSKACPAPCEGSCTAGFVSDPVSIKSIERAIIDRAFEEGWVVPKPPKRRTGKKVAVIGSGPAGLACADQLNKIGHEVTVFERSDRPGGLLMYGIPSMKIEKDVVDRRVHLLEEEGILFRTNADVGNTVSVEALKENYDAVILCTGAGKHREVSIEGRELKGISPAMQYLTASNRHLLYGEALKPDFDAKGKHVIVIGGGDTGEDCVATAIRQECKSVVQFGKHGKLPTQRMANNPWPEHPNVFSVDYAYEEAEEVLGKDPREYYVETQKFIGNSDGHVQELITGSFKKDTDDAAKKSWKADLVLIAIGFQGTEDKIFEDFKVTKDASGRVIETDSRSYQTSQEGIFAAGDVRRGASLIVWAIEEGRKAAAAVDLYLDKKLSLLHK
ncbi:MAG: glutamate synthase subunit beta [Sporolactobacillus sp.]|uniref:glutamate synthase subunit beta n=1 Tax=Sporolactobacillus sp. STSJ-5 TaxID=2965076 RepID=UPI0021021757|nr:glutamate synthase subunit beta [Sporolactobacillus sp. STSJ-5]MCQ2009352.1 glutamate synthase subunit beta [Sporolactobacillus sp. STSJ-5]